MSAPDEPRDDVPAPPAPATPMPPPDLPRPMIARRAHYSLWLVWLVPLVAVIIGIGLGARSILNRGPTVTIYFHNAEGIEANKTHIKYKDVDVGIVRRVKLTKDHREVEVTAEMRGNSGIENLLVTDTRFWVVRPRVGAAGVSGLGTLLSGAYIGMDAGRDATEKREFEGLDVQPAITADVPGREFSLVADDLGSLDIGSPIYLRRVPVGQVLAYTMMPDGRHIRFTIFITAPYDRFVSAHSRFWHASGVDVDLGAQGLHVQTQSVVSVLAGGVAFQELPDPDNAPGTPPEAPERTQFTLYGQMSDALKLPDSQGFDYRLLFASSVRGLAVGAPVEYRGLPIGEVTRIAVDGSSGEANPEPMIAVDVRVYPRRLPTINKSGHEDMTQQDQRKRIDPMVKRGFRAQLKSGSLLTGQLYVSLDFVKQAPAAHIDWTTTPPTMPTAPGGFDDLQASLSSLAKKLDAIPYDQLAQDLHKSLSDLDVSLEHVDDLVTHLDTGVVPEARNTLADARKAVDDLRKTLGTVDQTVGPQATEALDEVSKAAASLKGLADFLKRHPESLLKGKPEDPK
ncbi:MAG: MlaD family protein [Pseudomonadota bacterium]|nr:MlaD family protein [Pseudomonadota bacterium]